MIGPGDVVVAILSVGRVLPDTLAADAARAHQRCARGRDHERDGLSDRVSRSRSSVLYTRAGLEVGVAATETFADAGGGDVPAGHAACPGAAGQATSDEAR